MNSTKKNKPVSEDPVNTKIQRQFNLVFDKDKSKSPNENKKDKTDGSLTINEDYDLSPINADGTKTSMNKTESATISLDLKTDSNIKHNPLPSSDEQGTLVASLTNDMTKSEGLDFSLDFNLDGGESTVIAPSSALPSNNGQTMATSSIETPTKEPSLGGFVLDELDLALNLSENTQKTVIANLDLLRGSQTEEEDPKTSPTATSTEGVLKVDDAAAALDLLGNSAEAEEKASIESTIKDIVRPKFDGTAEMDLGALTAGEDFSDLSEEPLKEFRVDNNQAAAADSNVLDFGSGNTPGEGFNLDALKEEASSAIDLGTPSFTAEPSAQKTADKGDEFSLLSNDDDIFAETSYDSADSIDDAFEKTLSRSLSASMKSALADSGKKLSVPTAKAVSEDISSGMDDSIESLFSAKNDETSFNVDDEPSFTPKATAKKESSAVDHSESMPSGTLNTEDSMRFQATIRALREEREELLGKIKALKAESKEFEQDNLTLKANLDEARIEITILRKRHMVELEDIKYRLSMSEEKKALAEEKARQAEMRKEKLEQKVRIDFNQVKQREKELESKLELLSMDVDSQVQSRDQKILELRRKIDALEFNMENASIKEQKSLDDKRKLEDRLNKIMKTLRHSIKNLEDDIDHASEDSDREKDKN